MCFLEDQFEQSLRRKRSSFPKLLQRRTAPHWVLERSLFVSVGSMLPVHGTLFPELWTWTTGILVTSALVCLDGRNSQGEVPSLLACLGRLKPSICQKVDRPEQMRESERVMWMALVLGI